MEWKGREGEERFDYALASWLVDDRVTEEGQALSEKFLVRGISHRGTGLIARVPT